MTTRTRLILTLALLMLAAVMTVLLTAGCGDDQPAGADPAASAAAADTSVVSTPPEVPDVTLIMDWVPWVLDIPIDVAQEQGFYADLGLAVEQKLPAGATDVVKFVSTGRAQLGLYYAPDTLLGAGEGAPLLSVAGLMTHAPLGMAMAPGVSATKPSDLIGKTVGVVMVPSTRASFETMLRSDDVDAGDVKVVDPGYDLVAPLLAGKFGAVSVTEFGELVQAEATGTSLDYLDFRDWGVPDYAFLNVITREDFARENPATVRAFVAATLAGLEYAVANPDEAVAIYVKRHPELDAELLAAQWKAAIPSMATGQGVTTGEQDLESWQELGEWMVQSGQLEGAVDANTVVTNDYLPVP